MSDQGISEEELEKLLMESELESDGEETFFQETTAAGTTSSPASQSKNEVQEADRTMSQEEIDALLASFSSDDD